MTEPRLPSAAHRLHEMQRRRVADMTADNAHEMAQAIGEFARTIAPDDCEVFVMRYADNIGSGVEVRNRDGACLGRIDLDVHVEER